MRIASAIFAAGLLLCLQRAYGSSNIESDLEQSVGRAFLMLAHDYTVGGSNLGPPKVWTKNKRTHEPGISLTFFGPLMPAGVQKNWRTYHQTESQSFVVIVRLKDKKIIRIEGTYGNVSLEYIDKLIAELATSN